MVKPDTFATLQIEFWFGYDRAIVVDVCDRDRHDHHAEFSINGNGWVRLVFKHIGVHLCSPKLVLAKRVRESCVVNVNLFSTIGCPPRVYNASACIGSTACVCDPNHVYVTLPRARAILHAQNAKHAHM